MVNIRDVPFNPQYTEEQLEEAKGFLRNRKLDYRYTSNYCIVGDKGLTPYVGMACHKNISTHEGSRILVATECGWERRLADINGHKHGKEVFEGFFDWLTTDSYLARFILWADLDLGFIVSADMPAPLLQNLMITTRHFFEVNPEAFKTFDKLVADGIRGDLAYYVCFNSGFSLPSAKLNGAVRTYVGHRALPLANLTTLLNFLSGELGDTKKDNFWLSDTFHYRQTNNYSGGWRFFSVGNDVKTTTVSADPTFINCLFKDEEFRNGLSEYRKGKNGGIYKPPNPFDLSTRVVDAPKADECSYEELFDFVVPFVQAKYINSAVLVKDCEPETIQLEEAA